jgi:AraC family transcriptional regulator, regulatory protein of adaptative response / DNA-3-methyladenine glycosylase II
VELNDAICDAARRSRDARFDGRFFIAVTTTRVYCRPVCPVPSPKEEHIRYFPTAAAAEAAGYRPCLRCRPEASPGTPAWSGTSAVVSRSLRLIGEGALDSIDVERFAASMGVTARHLRRLFVRHLGATPTAVALTRRLHFAKKLIDETGLSFAEVATAAGFGSLRRFNGVIRATYARTPTELRRLARRRAPTEAGCYRFTLTYRPPYDWDAMLAFLRARAIPRVEIVEGKCYRRTIAVAGSIGTIAVAPHPTRSELTLDVRLPQPASLLTIVERVRRVFDLGADPAVVRHRLASDRLIGRALTRHPGLRVPGAWDGFELAVRAILGQQISVRAASTIAGRVADLFGTPVAALSPLDRLFPEPARLAEAPLERAGVIAARAETIRRLARAVDSGTITFSPCTNPERIVAALRALPGIGEWTAQYIAMRALGEPDAFPRGDLVLQREAGARTATELARRAEAWRPWRAYAVLALWQRATDAAIDARTAETTLAHKNRGLFAVRSSP